MSRIQAKDLNFEDIKPGKFYSTAEVSNMLRISKTTLRFWLRKDFIKGVKLGKRWFLKGEDILKIAQEGFSLEKKGGTP